MRGLWLLPSRRRLGKLAAFFEAATRNGMTTPGAVIVQKDELAELKDQYAALALPANWKVLPSNGDGLGDKCREMWDGYKNLDWVGLACDDLRPQTPCWDTILLQAVNGKNMVSCNDGQQGSNRMAGITIFSGGLLRAMGYMFPPFFWHTFTDNVWEEIGREAGCWTYVKDVLVLHDHPFRNQKIDPALADDTTNKSYGQQARDIRAFHEWRALEKDATIKRIKEMA